MHLLVLNPNTSAEVTAALQAQIGTELAPSGASLHTATATLGARYIASEASYAIAGHAALDAWAAHAQGSGLPDATLIGCFGDPGLFALRELSERPVVSQTGHSRARGRHCQAAASACCQRCGALVRPGRRLFHSGAGQGACGAAGRGGAAGGSRLSRADRPVRRARLGRTRARAGGARGLWRRPLGTGIA